MATKNVSLPKMYIICDQRRKNETTGLAPVRLIVKALGVQKVYGLDIRMTQADFNQVRQKYFSSNLSEKKKEELKSIKEKIEESEKKARKIISELTPFTFEAFKEKMFGAANDTLFTLLEAKIETMLKAGRAGNATTYMSTLNTLRLFRGGKREFKNRCATITGGEDIAITGVTIDFLNDFEQWYISQKKKKGKYSKTTVGIYVRNIRVILNDAIAAGLMPADAMPIGLRKYRIPGSAKKKFALKLEDIGTIMYAKLTPGSAQEMYRDYFLFSYLANGINLSDMAGLRYEDIDSEKISYIRAKTAFKKLEEPEFINVPLSPELGKIIDTWGNKPAIPESYVFPILKPGMTEMEKLKAIKATLRSINTNIKNIAKVFEIEGNISFYVARHSYATILKNSGVSVQAISENLGHSSVKVTKSYLDDFDIAAKREQNKNLIPKKAEN